MQRMMAVRRSINEPGPQGGPRNRPCFDIHHVWPDLAGPHGGVTWLSWVAVTNMSLQRVRGRTWLHGSHGNQPFDINHGEILTFPKQAGYGPFSVVIDAIGSDAQGWDETPLDSKALTDIHVWWELTAVKAG